MGNTYMEKLPITEYLGHYESRLPGPHLETVVASILAGNSVGELWVGSDPDASPVLLWDQGNNVFYFAGDLDEPSSFEALAATIAEHVRPRALQEGAARFKARPLSRSMEERLPDLFPGVAFRTSATLFFVGNGDRALPDAPVALTNLALMPITRDILEPGAYAHSNYVRAEIRSMWPSEERFYEHGFGRVAVVDGEIICWCTAEYLSKTSCGIGIETSPRYEGRGVATATASHFLREARDRGITARWECDRMNHASVRVAEKLGFALQSEEAVWIGSF